MKVSPATVISGAVALIALVLAFIIGVGFVTHGYDSRTTSLIGVVIGLVGPTVASIVALLKTEQTHHELKNGLMTSKVKDALDETGVTKAIAQGDQTTTTALNALSALLRERVEQQPPEPPANAAGTGSSEGKAS